MTALRTSTASVPPAPPTPPTPPATAVPARALRAVFWAVLLAFLAWDYASSPPVDTTQEPPLLAAGSGQAVSGGHCSMPE